MAVIEIKSLSKDYGNKKGVFDVTLNIEEGQVYGYLGPNGAGKSTTIRHLMGFIKAQQGQVHINGKDCWKEQQVIQKNLGYLPGEIAFPNDMNGKCYLKMLAEMRGMKDDLEMKRLIRMFEIDPNMSLKRMSKGMKQKIGIISAFMHEPDIFLLDEPTSGLDPLMQNRFLELIEEQKQKGKTILMSSHIFEEVEKVCDRIGMIKEGHLIQEIDAKAFSRSRLKLYKVEFDNEDDIDAMLHFYKEAKREGMKVTFSINDDSINTFIEHLSNHKILYLKEEKHSLEEYFMKYYGGEDHD